MLFDILYIRQNKVIELLAISSNYLLGILFYCLLKLVFSPDFISNSYSIEVDSSEQNFRLKPSNNKTELQTFYFVVETMGLQQIL